MANIDFNEIVKEKTKGVEYGTIQLSVKVHRSTISKIDSAKATYIKIDGSNPDADAAGVIISVLKAQQAKGGDGSLGFSVLYRKNKPVQVQVQEFIPEQL